MMSFDSFKLDNPTATRVAQVEVELGQVWMYRTAEEVPIHLNQIARTLAAEVDALAAELARVKAESLRVVVDGDACRICDADEGVILFGGNVYQITDHSEWIGMAEGVRYLHQEIPEYDEDTIVQPVRIERWEDDDREPHDKYASKKPHDVRGWEPN